MKQISFKILTLFIYLFLFTHCNLYQETMAEKKDYSIDKEDFEEGKCYAKCLISNQYIEKENDYIVYTGNELDEDVDTEVLELEIKPNRTEWVQERVDGNCVSSNPDDCLVWCLEEVQAEVIELILVNDTSQTNNYEIQRIPILVLNEKRSHTAWREVICDEDITISLITDIQNALRKAGFYSYNNTNTPILDSKTKASLKTFQRENQLPIGYLNLETLNYLGIIINY